MSLRRSGPSAIALHKTKTVGFKVQEGLGCVTTTLAEDEYVREDTKFGYAFYEIELCQAVILLYEVIMNQYTSR